MSAVYKKIPRERTLLGMRTRSTYRPDGWCQHRLDQKRMVFYAGKVVRAVYDWNVQMAQIPVPIPSGNGCAKCHSFISLHGEIRYPTGVDFTFVHPNHTAPKGGCAGYVEDVPGHCWWATRSSGTMLSPWLASSADLYDSFNDVDDAPAVCSIHGVETRMRLDGVVLWRDPAEFPALYLRIVDWGPFTGESVVIKEDIYVIHHIFPCQEHEKNTPEDYSKCKIDGEGNPIPPSIPKN